MNIVVVIKNEVILVFNPRISRMPPKASVKPADQANTSGINENGVPNCVTNSINQSETSRYSKFIEAGVHGVPNLFIAKTKDKRYPVINLGININILGKRASTLKGIINFLMGWSWWYIGLSFGYLNLLKFKLLKGDQYQYKL